MRRATISSNLMYHITYISIHALLAESDHSLHRLSGSSSSISIHALLAESDTAGWRMYSQPVTFLSTLSLRRATCPAGHCIHPTGISIHALLAESDHLRRTWQRQTDPYFYPRSPCGERLCRSPPSRLTLQISIHALLAESDLH